MATTMVLSTDDDPMLYLFLSSTIGENTPVTIWGYIAYEQFVLSS